MGKSFAGRGVPLLLLLVPLGAESDDQVAGPWDDRPLETITVTATRREERSQDVSSAVSQVRMSDVLEAAPDVIAEAPDPPAPAMEEPELEKETEDAAAEDTDGESEGGGEEEGDPDAAYAEAGAEAEKAAGER